MCCLQVQSQPLAVGQAVLGQHPFQYLHIGGDIHGVPLEKLVRQGKFREDLFYRLNVVSLDVPPLRDRKEDIPLIADELLKRLNARLGMGVPGISEDAKERLKEYDWPGNVRELQNVIERAMNLSWADTLTWKHFSDYFSNRMPRREQDAHAAEICPLRKAKSNAESEMIARALESTGGNKTATAELLGITRAMLYRKLKKYEISL